MHYLCLVQALYTRYLTNGRGSTARVKRSGKWTAVYFVLVYLVLSLVLL